MVRGEERGEERRCNHAMMPRLAFRPIDQAS
jgi:hypothetical protein